MISYELAKELKAAGFPQKTIITHVGQEIGMSEEDGSDYVTIPTLSELIEWCGDKFQALQRDINADGKISWCAVEEWEMYYAPEVSKGSYGDSPEEAIARLGIAIHKK